MATDDDHDLFSLLDVEQPLPFTARPRPRAGVAFARASAATAAVVGATQLVACTMGTEPVPDLSVVFDAGISPSDGGVAFDMGLSDFGQVVFDGLGPPDDGPPADLGPEPELDAGD